MPVGESTGRIAQKKTTPGLGDLTLSKMLDAIEGNLKKERNKIYKIFQLLSRKQRNWESLEQFHWPRVAPAHWNQEYYPMCSSSTNQKAQNELCRATKIPEEVYVIALSYKRGI